MKAWTIAGAGLVLMSGVGIAMAQAPAAPPPAADASGMEHSGMEHPGMHGGMGGPMGEGHDWRHRRMGEMMRHMMPQASKAAHFRLRKGDALIDVQCAEDEPMKACVDAASALMDKAAAK